MSWRAGIHGYAARWGVVTAPLSRPRAPHLSRPARFERDCFYYDAAAVQIWFMHRETQVIGVGADVDLRMWSDAYGLAFAFKPPTSAFNLVCGIAEARYNQCSAGFAIERATTAPYGSTGLDSVSRAKLNEISICPRGACPGAICWHSGNGPVALPSYAASLLPQWELSRSRYLTGGAS